MASNTAPRIWRAEPVAVAEAIKLLIGNVMAMLIGFSLIDWTAEQVALFLALVNSSLGVVLTILARDASVPSAKMTGSELAKVAGRKAA